MSETVVITGGGTGGHLNVAKEFINELKKRGIKTIYIGSANGKDKEWFENYENLDQTYFMNSRGVVNKNFLGKIKALLEIMKESFKCLKILKKYNVSKVISVGGYSAAPASFAGILKFSCSLYIHEQNSKMGKLNLFTKSFAKDLFSSYEKDSKVKNYPVKVNYFNDARIRSELQTIIFLGGSHGAKAINDFALSQVEFLKEKNIKIIHQTGINDYERVRGEYSKLNLDLNLDLFAFDKNLDLKMREADFAVSRAGASTLWELCASCIPTLYIPYPYAAADHQYYNAKFLNDNNMCFISREKNLNKNLLKECFEKDLNKMSKDLSKSIENGSISDMCDIILENK
ncbi:MAG: UDP-N-acetylglucosamine--N-acetylmuramyl-(pentapeptide) pyrophosphoryl-undecaprenol N-acetylglucosamine transferase [Campylobacterales bacterium]|nr:UDP-N-acetylglucosamine--N-acetylmuramyl-(pentapeptide) pyrophosphoryl-undecaprenol N-acetylglucosamine transferase [Campylobacterales bacterium]